MFQGIPHLSRLVKSQEARIVNCLLYNVTIQDDNLFDLLHVFNYNLKQFVPMLKDKQKEIVHIVKNLIKQQGPIFIQNMPFDGERIKKNFNYTQSKIISIGKMLKEAKTLWNNVAESYYEHKSWLDEAYKKWFDSL